MAVTRERGKGVLRSLPVGVEQIARWSGQEEIAVARWDNYRACLMNLHKIWVTQNQFA